MVRIFTCTLLLLLFLFPLVSFSPLSFPSPPPPPPSLSLHIPPGYGGPHAGFFAVKKKLIKSLPGRIVGKTWLGQTPKGPRGSANTSNRNILLFEVASYPDSRWAGAWV